MAKGLAVVSGSNDVVFKALETGIVDLGSNKTDAVVTVSGSLTLKSHTSGSGDVLIIQDLVNVGTASAGNSSGILVLSGTVVKEASHLSSSYVMMNDGVTTVEAAILSLSQSLQSTILEVSGGAGTGSVDLQTGILKFENNDSDIVISAASLGDDVVVSINLDDNISVGTLQATSSVSVTGSVLVSGTISASSNISSGGSLDLAGSASIGNTLTVESGGAVITGSTLVSGTVSVTGDITASSGLKVIGALTGSTAEFSSDVTVRGSLFVNGTVTSVNTSDLLVSDTVIMIGSGSSGTATELALVFGNTDQLALEVEAGKFTLGSVSPASDTIGTGSAITVNDDGVLSLGSLSASVGIAVNTLAVTGSGGLSVAADLTVVGATILSGNVTLGTGNEDSILVDGKATFNNEVRMPIFSVTGANAVAGFPSVPDSYWQLPQTKSGHMFYLTSSDGVSHTGDGNWVEANKWYMNERGVWHESFFFNG